MDQKEDLLADHIAISSPLPWHSWQLSSPFPSDELSIFLSLDFAFHLKENNNSTTSEALPQLPENHYQFRIHSNIISSLSALHYSFPLSDISANQKTTKISFVTPLQSPGTLEMPNTETNTSLAYGIGVQEYSWCFKVVCFMLVIQKVTSYKAYIFTSL